MTKKKFFIICCSIMCCVLASFMVGCSSKETHPALIDYTVLFETGEHGTSVAQQIVRNGKGIDEVKSSWQDTTNPKTFVGWLKEDNTIWQYDVDVVTSDITLIAKWREYSELPLEPSADMVTGFSSSFSWYQAKTDGKEISIKIKSIDNASIYQDIEGEVETFYNGSDMNELMFTPYQAPQGGKYTAIVVTDGVETILLADNGAEMVFHFKGDGTDTNPFLAIDNSDIRRLISDNLISSSVFIQLEDIVHKEIIDPIVTSPSTSINFSGVYNGNGKSITYTGSRGLFSKITSRGEVKNLSVIGSLSAINQKDLEIGSIGGITNDNSGIISNCVSKVAVTDERYTDSLSASTTIDTLTKDKLIGKTGGGGIAGINQKSGQIINCTYSGSGAVKVAIGGGSMAAVNYGLIKNSSSSATMPAGNQANSANTSGSYSFTGGIAGFNFGTIQDSSFTGRVFAQSAYAEKGKDNKGKQQAFGGIVGYNGKNAKIVSCKVSRNNTAKEFVPKTSDTEGVASIHGDVNIGGVAGINDGLIDRTTVKMVIVGGRDYIGGIAGKSSASAVVKNSLVMAEVAVKNENGDVVTYDKDKTTCTTYKLFGSTHTTIGTNVYASLQKLDGSDWASGESTTPQLPKLTQEQVDILNTDIEGELTYDKDGNIKDNRYFSIESVVITASNDVTLPEQNNLSTNRMNIAVGTEFYLNIEFNPTNATNQNYTITTQNPDSNHNCVIGEDGKITVVSKADSSGNFGIIIQFEDSGFEKIYLRFKAV